MSINWPFFSLQIDVFPWCFCYFYDLVKVLREFLFSSVAKKLFPRASRARFCNQVFAFLPSKKKFARIFCGGAPKQMRETPRRKVGGYIRGGPVQRLRNIDTYVFLPASSEHRNPGRLKSVNCNSKQIQGNAEEKVKISRRL